ncbi:MAG TPA: hypothetical protein VMU24_11885 [Candidatus Acidoferrales bacterium]|nr:hypothetical protein [Candidatus Acidoferrales bacterium]
MAPEPALHVATEPPLPTVTELFNHLREHQKELERIRQNYIFVVDEEEQDTVKSGGYRTRETNTYEIRYSGPWQVRTLVARDGKPLPPEDLKKNKEESDKLMHLAQQSMTRLASDPMAQGSSLNISDFLADDEFHNMRREEYQGHRVLVFDFVPRADFQPSTAHEKFIKNLGGTIWVDESAVQLVRLEAHLLNNVSYGGFLASIKKGKILVMEQRKVNNEIWLPSFEEFHLDARAFLSGKHVNLADHFRDYRRFRVESAFKPLEEGDPIPGEMPQSQPTPSSGTPR